ncbi:M20 aminoacylase family protein [Ralstonia wenshanensis]|uniref:Hippurate hydrolase n=1 Tax=Ralstonia wenshanensis TaxID=2842456 RepID=A0AAD2B831_9RALS|nr:M20 aminoacylase family protein [Ralstonia wenshanensis]CAJ0703608.1 Hippurate hydrolase [Ralstonia wenshanensis]
MIVSPPIEALKPELVRIRHQLHAHPELRFEEEQTAAFVASYLQESGIEVVRGIGGHGVVGTIKRGDSGRAIALRADMDALPLQELNGFSHASQHAGKMHACGHDGHTTMLLGAARHLAAHGDFNGTVHFIFQPAEEGGAGAKKMLDDGLFERFPCDAIFGLHNWPGLPAGNFGVRPDAIMASSNTFEVEIHGNGSHAAQPHRSVDPVMVAVQIAQAWQSIVSRNVDPNAAAVLSVTQIHAGTAVNVIPETAVLRGTVRTFDTAVLDLIEQRMRSIADGIGGAFGAELRFDFHRMYPAVVNHPGEASVAGAVMRAVSGSECVDENVPRSMASEDFSFFLQRKPGCYAFLGNGRLRTSQAASDRPSYQLHSPLYDFNDDILVTGVTYWVELVRTWLGSHRNRGCGS